LKEYDWLSDTPESEPSISQTKENLSPRADSQLVKLFKSDNYQGTTVTDPEIITYIREVGISFIIFQIFILFIFE
jgi:hypothetical protein